MNLFQRYLADEFAEDYTEGRLSRREALKLIASVTGSLLMANSILSACVPEEEVTSTAAPLSTGIPTAAPPATSSPAAESTVATDAPAASAYGTVIPDDPAVIASEVQIPAADTNIMGYLARPSNADVSPVILICHENRGLTPHIQDV